MAALSRVAILTTFGCWLLVPSATWAQLDLKDPVAVF